MNTVDVEAENGSYSILIGENILSPDVMVGYEKYAVITDDTVYSLYGHLFPGADFIVLAPGEDSKSLKSMELVYEKLLKFGLDRKCAILALGGGVMGDAAGFAAATYMRGIDYVQAPTTLLAQVDSSVGGKVAVNIAGGKNMVGAFYQPKKVVADTALLKTLNAREFAAGMAEVIKYSYIYDAALYDVLLKGQYKIEDIVARCCRIKAEYVKEDPYDKGVRMQLNYGHTVGHAIEAATGFQEYLHGEAVAIGMAYAAKLGQALGISPPGLYEGTVSLLKKYNLPFEVELPLIRKALGMIGTDKKAEGAQVNFILIDKIGHAVIEKISVEKIVGVLW